MTTNSPKRNDIKKNVKLNLPGAGLLPTSERWVDVKEEDSPPKFKRGRASYNQQLTSSQLVPQKQYSSSSKGKPPKKKYASKAKHSFVLLHLRKFGKLYGDDSISSSVPTIIGDPSEIYTFKLSSEHNYSASAGGIVNTVLDNDPSTTAEWSSFLVLFSLVRIRRSEYRVLRAVSTAVPTTVSVGAFRPVMVAALQDNAGSPGSYAAIEDSPNVIVYNYAFDTNPHGFKAHMEFKGSNTPYWADTSTPASSTTFTGCPGCLQIYGESMPVTTECLFILRQLTLEFTNRI